MASQTRWTWVWVNSRSWWWTGRPGVLRFMGSQRVGHDWVTELNWTAPTKQVAAHAMGPDDAGLALKASPTWKLHVPVLKAKNRLVSKHWKLYYATTLEWLLVQVLARFILCGVLIACSTELAGHRDVYMKGQLSSLFQAERTRNNCGIYQYIISHIFYF